MCPGYCWWFLVGILSLGACNRGVVDPGYQDGAVPRKDQAGLQDKKTPPKTDGKPSPDFLHKVDLPVKRGAACHYGQCGRDLICMANVCKKMCTEPDPGCNDKTTECPSGTTCIWASTFSGACLEVDAQYLQPCSGGKICAGGTLCVTVGGAPAKCLKLCKYGCPAGVPCGQTTSGCQICVQ